MLHIQSNFSTKVQEYEGTVKKTDIIYIQKDCIWSGFWDYGPKSDCFKEIGPILVQFLCKKSYFMSN